MKGSVPMMFFKDGCGRLEEILRCLSFFLKHIGNCCCPSPILGEFRVVSGRL